MMLAKLKADNSFKVRLREFERRLLRFLGGRSERDVEYDFAYRNVVGSKLKIIDIGGCDSLLPLILAKEGHIVTVFDFRPYPEKHKNLRIIKGDFLTNDLPPKSYDVAILISTIEHVGLGGYGTQDYPDADFVVMKELRRILVDNGRVILTFPFNDKEIIIPKFERWYTQVRVKRLFDGWRVLDIEFWIGEKKIFGRWVKWKPAAIEEAAQAYARIGVQAVACFAIAKHPFDWWER